jgi:hypothetical protein
VRHSKCKLPQGSAGKYAVRSLEIQERQILFSPAVGVSPAWVKRATRDRANS